MEPKDFFQAISDYGDGLIIAQEAKTKMIAVMLSLSDRDFTKLLSDLLDITMLKGR